MGRLQTCILLSLVLIITGSLLPSCSKSTEKQAKPALFSTQFFALGTFCSIQSDVESFNSVTAAISDFEEKVSFHKETSEISQLNAAGGTGEWTDISADTARLLQSAITLQELTGGAFSPLLGAITGQLNFAEIKDGFTPPSPERARNLALQASQSWIDVESDPERDLYRARICGEGKIDLGGIAKGTASDIVLELLKEAGATEAIINLGGNVLTWSQTDRTFTVGLQDPHKERGQYTKTVNIQSAAVVTSGAYERSARASDGKTYHHIIDPSTGLPCEIKHPSVTVVAPSGEIADAWSTALFIYPDLEQVALQSGVTEVIWL